MDEPTHANENHFWDQVADWLLDPHGLTRGAEPEADAEHLRRLPGERDSHA